MKPLGKKNYGSIPHLLGSKLGKTDKYITEGQHNICTLKTRDKNDLIIVQEKYDGSNVGIARIENKIYALTRSGYEAKTSPYEQHHYFDKWVTKNEKLFMHLLDNNHRLVGEWMYQAHGLRYEIEGAPFVAFDLIDPNNKRFIHDDFFDSVYMYNLDFHTPRLVWCTNDPLTIKSGLQCINSDFEYHPIQCLDTPEGLVYRVERNGKVDFLAKYVMQEHESGKYLTEISGNESHINEFYSFL